MQTINNNWEGILGEQDSASGIWADFLNTIAQLTWSDYSILLLLMVFVIVGFKRGFALSLINFIWFIAATIAAAICYPELSSGRLIWSLEGYEFTSFAVLFVAFLLLKIVLYKILASIAKIHGPCPLNRFLAAVVGIGIAFGVSWVLANNVAQIELIQRLFSYEHLRFIVSFMLIFGAIMVTTFVLIKMLNIKVGIDHPCPLLVAIKPLDSILSARNVNSRFNHFFGLWLGLLKGLIFVVLIIIALNHAHYILDGVLTNQLNTIATNTQAVLADYLTFVKK